MVITATTTTGTDSMTTTPVQDAILARVLAKLNAKRTAAGLTLVPSVTALVLLILQRELDDYPAIWRTEDLNGIAAVFTDGTNAQRQRILDAAGLL